MLISARTPPHSPALAPWYDAIAGIGAVLDRPGLPDAGRCAAIRAITASLPPPPGVLDAPPGRLGPGAGAADAARMIGWALEWSAEPATVTLAGLVPGQPPPVIRVGGCGSPDRFTGEEQEVLGLEPGQVALWRSGQMFAGDVLLARTRLLLAAARTPPEAWAAVCAGEPAGTALGPYGLRRGRRQVTVTAGADPAVTAQAVLWLRQVPVGLAGEEIPASLCETLAAQARG